ncbi:MAG: ATP-dependent sacrificial sulfur transferase LarE [Brevinematales bacterium]|nr:ATP-dependent sacrificial sulfur transferase LarE [Brevinematales bacterium]
MIDKKFARLKETLLHMEKIAVAFSGGVDSTLLLKAAWEARPGNVTAYMVDSPLNKPGELANARETAGLIGAPFEVVTMPGELDTPAFAENTPERCYHCKYSRFSKLRELLPPELTIVEGTNADDLNDYRPGMRAVRELGIRSPLLETGLSKKEIRELSRRYGLPTAERPASPCLATRIPFGERITPERLMRIGAAEEFLNMRGFSVVRVRDTFPTARIEIVPEEMPRMTDNRLRADLIERLRTLGYETFCLDLDGYRQGKMNPKEILNG